MERGGSPEQLLRTREVAELWGISERKVRQLIYDGALPVVRIGSSVRIAESALSEFVAREV